MDIKDIKILKKLTVPSYKNRFLVSIEGPDGSGKTSICKELEKEENIRFESIPEVFNEYNIKKHMIFEANWITSAFFFLSGVMDTKKQIDDMLSVGKENTIIMDRSFWSTAVLNWVKQGENVPFIMELYEKISGYIPIPNLIIVLDVNYEECRRRIGMKSKTLQTLDQVPQREYAREMEFYYHLNTCNENVVLFDSNKLSVEQTVTAIKEIISKNMN